MKRATGNTVTDARNLQRADVLTSGGFYSGRTVANVTVRDGSAFVAFADGLRTSYDVKHRFEVYRAADGRTS